MASTSDCHKEDLYLILKHAEGGARTILVPVMACACIYAWNFMCCVYMTTIQTLLLLRHDQSHRAAIST